MTMADLMSWKTVLATIYQATASDLLDAPLSKDDDSLFLFVVVVGGLVR